MIEHSPSKSARAQQPTPLRYLLLVLVPFALGNIVSSVASASQSPPGDSAARTHAAADTEQHVQAIPGKVSRYVRRLIQEYDRNEDQQLQPSEWNQMRGHPAAADLDANGVITHDELARHVAAYGRSRRIRPPRPAFKAIDFPPLLAPVDQLDSPEKQQSPAAPSDPAQPVGEAEPTTDPPVSEAARRDLRFFVPSARLPKGLPAWFVGRDANGDGQLNMAEFAPKATRTQLDQFARYDADGDGVITAAEYLRRTKPAEKGPSQ